MENSGFYSKKRIIIYDGVAYSRIVRLLSIEKGIPRVYIASPGIVFSVLENLYEYSAIEIQAIVSVGGHIVVIEEIKPLNEIKDLQLKHIEAIPSLDSIQLNINEGEKIITLRAYSTSSIKLAKIFEESLQMGRLEFKGFPIVTQSIVSPYLPSTPVVKFIAVDEKSKIIKNE